MTVLDVLTPVYGPIAAVVARFLGPECTSAERGGCVWFTRHGPDINNHRCKGCGSAFCDVHHTADMCPGCTWLNYCLACIGKYTCCEEKCTRAAVEFAHGYHARYGKCIVMRDVDIARRSRNYVYNTGNKFACAEHAFKRTYDKGKALILHSHDCADPDNDPIPTQTPYRTYEFPCAPQ